MTGNTPISTPAVNRPISQSSSGKSQAMDITSSPGIRRTTESRGSEERVKSTNSKLTITADKIRQLLNDVKDYPDFKNIREKIEAYCKEHEQELKDVQDFEKTSKKSSRLSGFAKLSEVASYASSIMAANSYQSSSIEYDILKSLYADYAKTCLKHAIDSLAENACIEGHHKNMTGIKSDSDYTTPYGMAIGFFAVAAITYGAKGFLEVLADRAAPGDLNKLKILANSLKQDDKHNREETSNIINEAILSILDNKKFDFTYDDFLDYAKNNKSEFDKICNEADLIFKLPGFEKDNGADSDNINKSMSRGREAIEASQRARTHSRKSSNSELAGHEESLHPPPPGTNSSRPSNVPFAGAGSNTPTTEGEMQTQFESQINQHLNKVAQLDSFFGDDNEGKV